MLASLRQAVTATRLPHDKREAHHLTSSYKHDYRDHMWLPGMIFTLVVLGCPNIERNTPGKLHHNLHPGWRDHPAAGFARAFRTLPSCRAAATRWRTRPGPPDFRTVQRCGQSKRHAVSQVKCMVYSKLCTTCVKLIVFGILSRRHLLCPYHCQNTVWGCERWLVC